MPDGVSLIEGDIGFLWSELAPVMSHMYSTIRIRWNEGGVPQQPTAYNVVHTTVGEQQPMGGLVHQRGELGVCPSHQNDR